MRIHQILLLLVTVQTSVQSVNAQTITDVTITIVY